MGEAEVAYECTNKKCKWQGLSEEKSIKKERDWDVNICPKCGNNEFYGLLEVPTIK